MKYNISLNFLPLSNSNFTFQIYRRKVIHLEKKEDDKIFKYNLPDETGHYTSFLISFESFKNFELFTCSSKDTNIELTKCYINKLLIYNIKQSGLRRYIKKNKFNDKRVFIDLGEVKEKSTQKIIGNKTIWLEPYYLKTKKEFGYLIDYKFMKSEDYPFNREVQKYSLSLNSDYRSNVNYNIDKFQIINNFIKKYLSKISKINDDVDILNILTDIEADTLNVKEYMFCNNKSNNSQFNGIMNFGPFAEVSSNPVYYYIFKEEHIERARDLLKAINGNTYLTFKGIEKFKLLKQSTENTRKIIINNYSIEEINKVIAELKKNKNDNSIIISIFPKNEESFYYELKNKCLQENIPVQNVHIETITNYNTLKWSVGSIALQIFSKLGGVPWIVKPSTQNCLIVGLGQAHKYNRNKKEFDRYFSYSVLVDSSGKFLQIKQLADETDKNNFLARVSNNISKIIEEHKKYKKIIFHIPQKIKREEIENIENKLKQINSEIELSIIKINDSPKFTGFNIKENALVPYESSFIKLSNSEYLLWPEGLNYHNRQVLKKYGNPLHISFYYSNHEKDFNEHKKYLQDILNLSGANYRGFNAKSLPVSVYYPKLITNFSKHFNELNLNFTANDTKKPWFL